MSIEEDFFNLINGEKIFEVIEFIKYKNWLIDGKHSISIFFDDNSNITHWTLIDNKNEFYINLNYFDINFNEVTEKIKKEYKFFTKYKVYR